MGRRKKPFRCRHARTAKVTVYGKNGEVYCRPCWEIVSGSIKLASSHIYTGKKIWLGTEVYGKKLGSDELRADTERDLLKKNWSPWMEERIRKNNLDEKQIRVDPIQQGE